MTKFIAPEYLFDGDQLLQNVVIEIADGEVKNIHHGSALLNNERVTKVAGILSPGFIDVQVNGGGGVLFNDEPNLEGLRVISQAHRESGTCHILPTIITDSIEVMEQAANTVAAAIESKYKGILGVHFEGPHISIPKKGVHPEPFIRALSCREKALYARTDIGIKLITLDPGLVSKDDIQYLIKHNCVVCIGHTNASYQVCSDAIEVGAKGFTHLYNAMSPLTGREPGAVGAALNHDSVYAGIILDGFHVDYASAKLAWRVKNSKVSTTTIDSGKLFLVSDAMSSIGSDQTRFNLFGQTVTVNKGKLTNEFGTLAGAHLNLLMAVQNAHHGLQISLEESLRMAITYPAQFLKLDSKVSSVTVGTQANFIQLDTQLNLINQHSY
ncbi:N-acetylglucosamine-6-phosphate deacetylase [Psychrosphaera sp.]|nr:N-acetylglucosamine-6-phosphate deacetylase [Psychrosphaera sp.]